MSIIEVNNLTKDYGHGRGVYDVSFRIEKGEVFGFLGPNGAGKTTTIRHLLGFSNPQKGVATIAGMVCNKEASKILRNVGYLPGEVALPEALTGWAFIRMMQGLRGVHDEKRLKDLLDRFHFDPKPKTKKMSLGEKRKMAVVTAFMADPAILILDEPTSGLDPVMQETFIEFMREEKKRGKTILLSSHIFSEVDAVCNRISIIKDGKIVSTVKVDDIHHNENKQYEIRFTDKKNMTVFLGEVGFTATDINDDSCTVQVKIHDSQTNQLMQALAKRQVASFKEVKLTLESHFLHFYKKSV